MQHRKNPGTPLNDKRTQGSASKSELERQAEMDHYVREQFGATSLSSLELPASLSQAPAITKAVYAPTSTVYPGRAPVDVLVIVTAGSLEGESIHGNQRTRWSSRAGMIELYPVNAPIDQMSWQGAEMHATVLGVGNALSQLEMPRTGLIDSHAFDLARRLQYQAEHGVPLGVAYIEALTLTLTAYLRARYAGESIPREADIGPLSRLQCEELQAYIDAHIQENISLEHLAMVVGYSVSHLRRVFQKSFGMPPHRYIIERRVEQAKALVPDQNFSMADVALLSGFSSQAHMNMLFKRLTGVTPGAFRRSLN